MEKRPQQLGPDGHRSTDTEGNTTDPTVLCSEENSIVHKMVSVLFKSPSSYCCERRIFRILKKTIEFSFFFFF